LLTQAASDPNFSIYPESEKEVKNSSLGFFGEKILKKKFFFIFFHLYFSFLRTWLAFKVRKGQKEALKAPGRHDSMSHPTPKFYGDTLL
jgi:hypothetical protein